MFSFITSGTYEFLYKIKEKYAGEDLVFMYNEDTAILIHETESETIFKEPRRYEMIDSVGSIKNGKFAVMNNIPVTDEGRPVFEYRFKNRGGHIEKEPGFIGIRVLRPLSSDTYIILTVWETETDFQNWQKSKSFEKAHAKPGKEKITDKKKSQIFPRPSYVTKFIIPKED